MAGGGKRARVLPLSAAVTYLDTGNGPVSIQGDGGWDLDRGGVEARVGWVVGTARAGWVKDEGCRIGRRTCWGTGMECGGQRCGPLGFVLTARGCSDTDGVMQRGLQRGAPPGDDIDGDMEGQSLGAGQGNRFASGAVE